MVNLALAQKDMQQANQLLEQLLIEFPNNVAVLATNYLVSKQGNKRHQELKRSNLLLTVNLQILL